MTIRASCGHVLTKEEDMGFTASWKSYNRMCEPAVDFGVLCSKCLKEYDKEGLLLKTEDEEQAYMESEP